MNRGHCYAIETLRFIPRIQLQFYSRSPISVSSLPPIPTLAYHYPMVALHKRARSVASAWLFSLDEGPLGSSMLS